MKKKESRFTKLMPWSKKTGDVLSLVDKKAEATRSLAKLSSFLKDGLIEPEIELIEPRDVEITKSMASPGRFIMSSKRDPSFKMSVDAGSTDSISDIVARWFDKFADKERAHIIHTGGRMHGKSAAKVTAEHDFYERVLKGKFHMPDSADTEYRPLTKEGLIERSFLPESSEVSYYEDLIPKRKIPVKDFLTKLIKFKKHFSKEDYLMRYIGIVCSKHEAIEKLRDAETGDYVILSGIGEIIIKN